jgi:hypothetical protein
VQLRLGICPVEVEVDRSEERNKAETREILRLSIELILLLLLADIILVFYL